VRHLLSLAMPPDSMIVGADRKLSHF
jgi:hypothetical protein